MSRSNTVIEALGALIADTLCAAFAPNECRCDLNLFRTDITKLPPEATPFAAIQRLQPSLVEAGNGWPSRKLRVVVWIFVRATGETSDDPLGLEGRLFDALETLEDTLVGNLLLSGELAVITPDGDPNPVCDDTEGSCTLPLAIEIARD